MSKTDNELIAEFMGLVRRKPHGIFALAQWWRTPKDRREKGKFVGYPEQLEYDTSWDWLMPVVEKIRKVVLPELHKNIPPNSATNGDLIDVDISCGFMEVDIKIVYKHVVEFIKWYNQQKNP